MSKVIDYLLKHWRWIKQWSLWHPTQIKKIVFFVLVDSVIVVASLYGAFLLRFDFNTTDQYFRFFSIALPVFLIIKLSSFLFFNLYRISWRFVSLRDLYNIIKAVITSSLILMVIIYFLHFAIFRGFPRGIIVIDAVITLVSIATLRISKRAFLEVISQSTQRGGKRTLIVGAGHTGEIILRDMEKNHQLSKYTPVAIVDDDLNIQKMHVHGVRVVGALNDVAAVVSTYRIQAIIIAIPSLGHARLLHFYQQARDAGVTEIKIVPGLYNSRQPEIHVQALEDIKIEDLIGRQAVEINFDEISKSLQNKTVLVTGAAGSIGFELVVQACRFQPRAVILFEIDETELYHAERKLRHLFPSYRDQMHFVIGDVRDQHRLTQVFTRYKPEVVLHAAAYKHVPMMEYNMTEAAKVNIIGTYSVAKTAIAHGAQRFIMISTDKAVMPTSIMGATKRMAEIICQTLDTTASTDFVSVRFGNVLGSRGSVLPLFLEQIQHGGPITITDREMRRYFMTIPEAVSLVLQAGAIGRGGEVMVLDMGEPVKILELAEELLKLHNLKPYEDVDIEFIGLRPGEKLFEDILTAEEGTAATQHKKIFTARDRGQHSLAEIEQAIQQFSQLITTPIVDEAAIRRLLRQFVRWYDAKTDQR